MGPLEGLRIIELQGIGPGPFCAMMLADMGAEVIRIDRTGAAGGLPRKEKYDLLARGRRSIRLDLKRPEGKTILLDMVEKSPFYEPGALTPDISCVFKIGLNGFYI